MNEQCDLYNVNMPEKTREKLMRSILNIDHESCDNVRYFSQPFFIKNKQLTPDISYESYFLEFDPITYEPLEMMTRFTIAYAKNSLYDTVVNKDSREEIDACLDAIISHISGHNDYEGMILIATDDKDESNNWNKYLFNSRAFKISGNGYIDPFLLQLEPEDEGVFLSCVTYRWKLLTGNKKNTFLIN